MRRIFIVLFVLIFPLSPAFSTESLWQIIFGTEQLTGLTTRNLPEDLPFRLLVSRTGAYYVFGTNNYSEGNPRPGTIGTWAARIRPEGTMQWLKMIATGPSHPLLIETGNDGFLSIFKLTDTDGMEKESVNCLQSGRDGNVLWEKSTEAPGFFQGENCEGASDIRPVLLLRVRAELRMIVELEVLDMERGLDPDGTIHMAPRYFLVALDDQGRIKSSKILSGKIAKNNYRVAEDNVMALGDGRIYIVETHAESYDVKVTGFTSDARPVRSWDFTARTYRCASDILELPGGEIQLGLLDQGLNPGSTLIRIGADGTVKSSVQKQIAWYFLKTVWLADGTLLTIGSVGDSGEGDNQLYRLTPNGDVVSKKSFGGPGTSTVDFALLPGGQIIILCYTKDYGAFYIDALLMKVDTAWNFAPPPRRR